MISVCMATFNGEKYIREQVNSILTQLSAEDELVISDDHSSDQTQSIIQNIGDSRIRFLVNPGPKGPVKNFQHALEQSAGDLIFLADQDDIWLPGRVQEALKLHQNGCDLVACNCFLVDEKGCKISDIPYFNAKHPLKRGFLHNLYENTLYGCCMSFNRKVLTYSLPFPEGIIMHDVWIGMLALARFRCGYIENCLVLYRRHAETASFGKKKGGKSVKMSNFTRIKTRLHLLFHLLRHLFTSH